MKPRFLKLTYFVWLLVPLGLWSSININGSPHVLWSYSWRDEGQGYHPLAERWYTRCSYVGAHGTVTIYPTNGECRFIRFAQSAG